MGARIIQPSSGAGGGLRYVGSDTEATLANNAAETTLANVTVPASTIYVGIQIFASIHFYNTEAASHNSIFRLKTGAAGAETTKQTISLEGHGAALIGGSMLYYENTLSWGSAQSVILTVQNDAATANIRSTVFQLLVVGN